MIQKRYKNLSNLFALLITFFSSIVLATAQANPEQGVVSSGYALVKSEQSYVEITQRSNKAVIDWQSFNIEANEQTKFIQPSIDSIALNRIHSNTASGIKGELTANGKLILINQNGILFDKTAVVDVNGLIATTANISNDKFMQDDIIINKDFINDNNKLIFDQPGIKNSKIVNEGQIIAKEGLVGLIAPHVVNSGLIVAKAAKVQLVSGETFALDLYGDNLINIAVVSEDLENQLILNSGSIIADGNQIALTAVAGKNLVNSLIANTGALQARSVAQKNGEIIILAEGSNAVANNSSELKGTKSGESKVMVSGTIDVGGLRAGESGGKVQILGDNIGLIENAVINASGHSGKYNTTLGLDASAKRLGAAGGEILVGGDYLGKGKVPAARILTVEPGVTIYSDSTQIGDAGRIIFWSDGINKFKGEVYARSLGGATGNNYGDGGFVETSGKQLIVDGYVDLVAANGAVGTYLLDPSSITVHSNSADLSSYVAVPSLYYDPVMSGDSHVSANYLGSLGASVSLIADDIILDLLGDSVTLTNDRSLTIRSRNSFSAPSAGVISTARTSAGGNITIVNEKGNIDLTNLDLIANNNGAISLSSCNGTITLGNTTAGAFTVKSLGPNGIIYQHATNKKIMVQDAVWSADQKVRLLADDVFTYENNTFSSLILNANEIDTSSTSTLIPFAVSGGNVTVNSGKANLSSLKINASTGNVSINAFGDVNLGAITASSLTVNALQDLGGYYPTSNIVISDKKLSVQNLTLTTDFDLYLNLPAGDNQIANYTTFAATVKRSIVNNTPNSIVNVAGNTTFSSQNINLAGLDLNAAGNAINITATHGPATLGNLTANNVVVKAFGYAGDIIIPSGTHIVAAGSTNPLILVAEGRIDNQNAEGFNVFNVTDANARWLLYSSNPNSDQGLGSSFVGAHSFLYSTTYNSSSLPTQTGNLLIYASTDPAILPQLDGNYNDKNVADSKEVTVANLVLNGANASNYTLSATQSSGPIGKINKADVSLALTGTVTKVYDGTAHATNIVYNPIDPAVNNYAVTGFIPTDVPDGIGLDNYSVGAYYNESGTDLDKTVAVGKLLKVTGVTLTGPEINNYNLLSGDVSGNVGVITPKPLRVVLTDNSSQNTVDKIYDGSTTAVVKSINYILDGLVTVDNLADNVLLSNVGN